MPDPRSTQDVVVEVSDFVATVEIQRPPHNYFDVRLIEDLARGFEALDQDPACRAIVLAAQGKSFCAGANLGAGDDAARASATATAAATAAATDPAAPGGGGGVGSVSHLYLAAVRLFRTRKPVVAAVHGAAVGGGLGLALAADFRVTCVEARFSANFTRLGFHPGFGLTVTLPELIGPTRAALLFYTGRRVKGDEAVAMGLADLLVPQDQVRAAARTLAREIGESAPLAVEATRATLRRGLADRVRAATEHELAEQTRLRRTQDFQEGVRATAERRPPRFIGA
jgi:enoyl-CoA hydratase/carnithine racemase